MLLLTQVACNKWYNTKHQKVEWFPACQARQRANPSPLEREADKVDAHQASLALNTNMRDAPAFQTPILSS
jgi:hypothetical protein